MSMQDPISDLLTRIRNGQMAGKSSVVIPYSKVKEAIVEVLKQEGYLENYGVETLDSKKQLVVKLKYFNSLPVITKIKRVSTPGLRVYRGKTELPKILGGLGVAIISTPQGIMSGHHAAKLGHGGEVLCCVE